MPPFSFSKCHPHLSFNFLKIELVEKHFSCMKIYNTFLSPPRTQELASHIGGPDCHLHNRTSHNNWNGSSIITTLLQNLASGSFIWVPISLLSPYKMHHPVGSSVSDGVPIMGGLLQPVWRGPPLPRSPPWRIVVPGQAPPTCSPAWGPQQKRSSSTAMEPQLLQTAANTMLAI